ncbi:MULTISPECIES: hypothetical protein [unclassified Fibrobacter]|uniref:hypothetical protein n=1 Tax=unclassified Fibrobacter TaxID=2634177 RepID=UPI00090F5E5A|nr:MULTISPECIES: hypothetical protein [unclassified Fibrobacter]SHK60710.1 hypothetical protein SAMN05720759_104160 [Fibrobacter sp. UWB12]SIN96588.1 hypothetical protein SAMN05720758_0790 [Fibrobacter sp. UWB11]
MKNSIIGVSLAIAVALFTGCSSVVTPKAELAYHHDSVHNIPAIDSLIVSMKQDYIKQCYMPVASHMPPENSCQSDLFQMVERRYHMEYNQNHVAAASNELFFKDVVPEIQKKVKREPALRDPLRKAFNNNEEMLAYYKDKYKFNTQIEQF